jgi:hypothetical protein
MKIRIIPILITTLLSCGVHKRPFNHDVILTDGCRIYNKSHLKKVFISCDSLWYDLSKDRIIYLFKDNKILDSITFTKERSFKKKYYIENLESEVLDSVLFWTLDLRNAP